MLMSDGRLILADATPQFAFQTYQPTAGINLIGAFSNYGAIYRKQLWVYTVVHKRSLAVKRLPLKIYRHDGPQGREALPNSPLAQLLARPNPNMTGGQLWEWTQSTFDIYGEAIWVKGRNANGQVAALVPAHPTNINIRRTPTGELEYLYAPGILNDAAALLVFPQDDVVHFRSYNPDTSVRGLSPLEPLRQTLANEDAARRASTALWNNGGRPSGYLSHPNKLSDDALRRLRQQWEEMHGGVDNFGKFAILEEGMEPKVLSLSAEELQYIETRKLGREEVCGAYDIPPPVVHILDRATFSNITEQMRSMYRDTMAPVLGGLEDVLEQQLVPDFDPSGDTYPEFLMDEVLRGDFEQRVSSYTAAINAGWLSPNEVRAMENLPAEEGGEHPYINSALVPLPFAARIPPAPTAVTETIKRSLLGVTSRASSLDDIDIKVLIDDIDTQSAEAIEDLYQKSLDAGLSVAEFRGLLRDLLTKELTP